MKDKISQSLLDIKAIQINTEEFFTWTSGIKSPIYTDNRLIMSYPSIRKLITKKLAKLIKNNFKKVDYLVGVATSGIPHCTLVAEKLNLPMAYVRNSKKDHGKQNDIEGNLNNAKNIVVIEDLFSTGKSALNVINTLKDQKYNVIGCISIFSYNLKSLEMTFKDIEYYSLITINDLLDFSLKNNNLNQKDVDLIQGFLENLNSK